MFLDKTKVNLKSGQGGAGVVSFRREKYVPRGGPDGGDGGRGGHIIFQVCDNLSTLSDFRYKHHFKAGDGFPGTAKNATGKNGEDLIIPVPAGTIVKNAESNNIIADLTEPGMEVIILKGGRGGRGNSHFATPTRQTPEFAEKGEPGLELWVELELKLIADVGLIGFPNAGKSTLLSRVTAAQPKIADYPFTTIIPNLGVVDYKEHSFVVVDVPGLIEGAHQGIGLGDQFLRHIERTRILVHLVDLSSVLLGRDPYQDYLQINQELTLYNPLLSQRPQIVVANKLDIPEAQDLYDSFKVKIPDKPVLGVSTATGKGLANLQDEIIKLLDLIPKDTSPIFGEHIEQSPTWSEIKVVKENNIFIVKNDGLLKRISRFDLNNDESVRSLQRFLKRWGVEKALIDAGIQEGDSVQIGDFEFNYLSED